VPALLVLGPVSDRWGRRLVVLPALLVSVIGSLALLLAGESVAGLLIGRILVGLAAGAAFGPGTAWLKELSAYGGDRSPGATRAAVALSSGFAVGPLVSGAIAQWLPGPELTPYLTHVVLVAVLVPFIGRAPETVLRPSPGGRRQRSGVRRAVLSRDFLVVVLPTAPWVFGAATTPFVVLPALVGLGDLRIAGAGAAAALTLGTGVLVQSWARALSARAPVLPYRWGTVALTLGMLSSALTASTGLAVLLVPSSMLLGAAYGLLLVSGLTSVERLAAPGELGVLTGVFYTLTYVGFAFPLLVSALAPVLSGPTVLLVAAVVGAASSTGTLAGAPARRGPRRAAGPAAVERHVGVEEGVRGGDRTDPRPSR